jgi:hypothetical protein
MFLRPSPPAKLGKMPIRIAVLASYLRVMYCTIANRLLKLSLATENTSKGECVLLFTLSMEWILLYLSAGRSCVSSFC